MITQSDTKQRLDTAVARFTTTLQDRVEKVCWKHAEITRAHVVIDINTQKANGAHVVPDGATGRRLHIPSPPGGPPNADTGRLSASYTTTIRSYTRYHIAAAVVAGTIYAFWLEFGTLKLLPRPHLMPRFREQKKAFRADLNQAVKDAASKAKSGRKR